LKVEYFRQIFKKLTEISNYMNIRPVGAELFYVSGRTDDEAYSRFSRLCERA